MLVLVEKSNKFMVLEPESYVHNGTEIVVPRGFVTDLASIPRIFWGILPPHHYSYRLAALIHDYLLYQKSDYGYANQVFKEIMQLSGVKKWKVFVMYSYVEIYRKINRL
jgi:Protein of unknown function (DUF1353)